MDIDQYFLFKKILNPYGLIRYASFLFYKLHFHCKKWYKKRIDYYPETVRQKHRTVQRRFAALSPLNYYTFQPTEIRLATKSIVIKDEKLWDKIFDDLEDIELLHRWNWLLYDAGREGRERKGIDWGYSYVRSWIKHNGIGRNVAQLEPYTISERIVNLSIFTWTHTGKFDLPNDLATALELMAYQLADSVEYNELEATGNHVFNNARGLFFAGEILGNHSLTELALAIFRERIGKVISSDGFITEGSSHYHMLFTRWLLEVVWLAEHHENSEVRNLLKPPLQRALECSRMFMVSDLAGQVSMPLLGDISPDYPPHWLFTVPYCWLNGKQIVCSEIPPAKGHSLWYRLFDRNRNDAMRPNKLRKAQTSKRIQSYPDSFWYRFDWYGWTLFVHAVPGSQRNQAGHFHQDLTSFVLFRDGLEVFVDPGRRSYIPSDPIANQQKSCSGHNVLMVNGLSPGLTPNQQRYPEFYRDSQVKVVHDMNDQMLVVRLRHNGFSRALKSVGEHTRVFTLTHKNFEMDDQVEGNGNFSIETRFHLSPYVKVADDIEADKNESIMSIFGNGCKYTFTTSFSNMTHSNNDVMAKEDVSFISRSYGDTLPSKCLIFKTDISLPYESKFRVGLS